MTPRLTLRLALALATGMTAAALPAQVWRADQGDGTYRNPVLFADYPDPDIIRVGDDYYCVTTTFANAPGVTILHSKDLVNWRIATHVVDRLDGDLRYDLKQGGSYRHGFYAASLRFHNGLFYLAVTPVGHKTRIYRAARIDGPWTYRELDREAFDPALFIDADGTAYLGTSIGTDGTVTLLTLDKDLSTVTAARKTYYNKGAEGSKIIRHNGWYYLFNAIPSKLAMTVSRSRSLWGPWETKPSIDDSSGGHQGAIVDMADGNWYGFVMVDAGAIGRMTNISPIFWKDEWPWWGTPDNPDHVPARSRKPIAGHPFAEPPSSDDFSAARLGLQWQWNHNPDDSRWSLGQRPGFLRLHATQADGIWTARNTLTQKAQGPRARAVMKADIGGIRPGDICGLGTLGKYNAQLSVVGGVRGARALRMQLTGSTTAGPETQVRVPSIPIRGRTLWLRVDMDFNTSQGRTAYSLDNRRWTDVGGSFPLAFDWRTGTFQGQQIALSCYNPAPTGGYLDIDSFTLMTLPAGVQP
ncbi:glycoside hydrolase 43 family protein [Sphingobium sp. HBC34]|uniref:Glycoside hydrolase 43 family protein n=1 Tax=Sphingobium cyanobacteriorum TaxID=3063954 RepID=A0ABT8ZPF3_9SPHN|nr:glycoside hydrolase 43 family protein [Sphingobium sp. HBC34]MDO7836402.1 glycoside hydrolase 43 family protein [Sphingobium sp. HBC34]